MAQNLPSLVQKVAHSTDSFVILHGSKSCPNSHQGLTPFYELATADERLLCTQQEGPNIL